MIFINSYTSFPAVVVASPYITANLQAYYDFSNASSYPGSGLTVTDLSGMNRTLTFTAAPVFVSSPPYVVITNTTFAQRLNVNLNFTTGMTFEIVYRTTTINFQFIVQYDDGTNGFVVQVHPSLNAPYMNAYGTGISGIGNGLNTTNNSVVANTWYHLVFTITSGGVWTSYLNSVNRAGGTLATYNPSVTNRTLSIGGNNSSTTNVGIFRVYDRALTSGEITQNFNTVKSTYTFDSLEYPPQALTTNPMNITTASYGNGTYTSVHSSTASDPAHAGWRAFDKSIDESPVSFWTSSSSPGYVNGGAYNGSISTNGILGEWVQLTMPASIVLTRYSIQVKIPTGELPSAPNTWTIMGSINGGTTWTNLNSQAGINSWVGSEVKSYDVVGATTFSTFRLVVNRNNSNGGGAGPVVAIGELRFFGY